jgi:hypothetical protein
MRANVALEPTKRGRNDISGVKSCGGMDALAKSEGSSSCTLLADEQDERRGDNGTKAVGTSRRIRQHPFNAPNR